LTILFSEGKASDGTEAEQPTQSNTSLANHGYFFYQMFQCFPVMKGKLDMKKWRKYTSFSTVVFQLSSGTI